MYGSYEGNAALLGTVVYMRDDANGILGAAAIDVVTQSHCAACVTLTASGW